MFDYGTPKPYFSTKELFFPFSLLLPYYILFFHSSYYKGFYSTFFDRFSNSIFYNKFDSLYLTSYLFFLDINYVVLCSIFSDLLISDFANYKKRFLSIYNVISFLHSSRFIFLLWLRSNSIHTSVTSIFISSSWYERENWDSFGIFYYNNLDLRRILNDYGFNGHPLKKDFPLSGFVEIVFVIFFSLVCYDAIKMNQEFRFFHISSPWKFL